MGVSRSGSRSAKKLSYFWLDSSIMFCFKLLVLLLLAANDVYGYSCKGDCTQGQHDCDRDSDCVDGLVCEFDGWWGDDYCRAGPETVNAAWGDWGEWSECSVQCGADGTQERSRDCIPPKKGGYPCSSSTDTQTQTCNNGPCPVNGGWGDFGAWDECPVSCGGAEHSRYRACDNPAPEHGGDDCTVDGSSDTETEKCNENPCPINGGWGEWSSWPDCPVTCGGGTQGRTRVCDNPAPQFGGDDCTVDGSTDMETQACNENECPINGGWGEWSEWDECPVSCGGADQGRTRVCDNPAPQYGGDDCTADGTTDSETQKCNENPCPINGGWGDWSEWTECPVSCGGADQERTRVCDNPAPQYGGEDCTVFDPSASETQRCNENPCPIAGGFSDWDEWSPCTVECGGGSQTRARRCDNPVAQFGGAECEGDFTECQRCNLDPCPSECPA